MQYLAADVGSVYHACESRERVITKDGHWKWTGTTLCSKAIVVGISGNAIVDLIDCSLCRDRLRAKGYEV